MVLRVLLEIPEHNEPLNIDTSWYNCTDLLQTIDFIFSLLTERAGWLETWLLTKVCFTVILDTGENGRLVELFTDDLRPSAISQTLESTLRTNFGQEVQVNKVDIIRKSCFVDHTT